MQNNAWPSVHWNLYDYYFKPAGGFYGTKKADEPVHILYDYFGKKVKVVNSTLTANNNMTASVTVYNIPALSATIYQSGDLECACQFFDTGIHDTLHQWI